MDYVMKHEGEICWENQESSFDGLMPRSSANSAWDLFIARNDIRSTYAQREGAYELERSRCNEYYRRHLGVPKMCDIWVPLLSNPKEAALCEVRYNGSAFVYIAENYYVVRPALASDLVAVLDGRYPTHWKAIPRDWINRTFVALDGQTYYGQPREVYTVYENDTEETDYGFYFVGNMPLENTLPNGNRIELCYISGEYFDVSELTRIAEERFVHDTYVVSAHDDLRECEESGQLAHIDDLVWCERSGRHVLTEYVMPEYDEDDESESDSLERAIDEYYRPFDRYYHVASNGDSVDVPASEARYSKTRYFGVELETEIRDGVDDYEAVGTVMNHFHSREVSLASDGSLSRGIEIRTMPGTLDWHRKLWEGFCENVNDAVRSWAHPNCGLHVHISRNSASALNWGKFIAFIDSPDHKRITCGIAGRDIHYAQYAGKDITAIRHNDGAKFVAVNLCHTHTVEVRIFKGCLTYTRILGYLEYCESVLQWTRDESVSQLTYDRYFAWVAKRRKQYPSLIELLDKQGFADRIAKPNQTKKQKMLTASAGRN